MALTWLEVQALMQPGEAIEVADLFSVAAGVDGPWRLPGASPGGQLVSESRRHGWRQVEDAARAVCSTCPAREPCLAYALANPELVGIWAGTTKRERRQMRRAA